jgi:integrase
VVTLRWQDVNLEEHTIRKEVKKTKRTHRLKFGQTALGILSKYLPENPNPEDFVFPAIFEKNFFLLSEKDKKKIMNSCNNICGFHLRKIGKELGLPFTLSFHLSRHTFATMALNKGMRIEHVSKLMDHAKISTTQIYAKIIDEELDKAVDEFVI